MKDRQKAYREKHKALGLCVSCNNPSAGGIYCTAHAAKAQIRAMRHKKARAERGQCYTCGRPMVDSRCPVCSEPTAFNPMRVRRI